MYAKPFTKILGLVGFRVKSKIPDIGTSEINWKDYRPVQRGQTSHLQSDSSKNQDVLYGSVKMHINSIMGTRCVYSWTNIMVDMDLDNIVHNDRERFHDRIFNAWIGKWESYIVITRYQENEQLLLQKYKNIRFLDDEDNQAYTIAPENLELKGTTRRNKQYCVVGQTLNFRDGNN